MDCSALEEIFIDEWSASLVEKSKDRRFPLGGMFELTDRCNMNCVHCYINQPATNKTVVDKELSTRQVKNILDQVAEAGCLFLTFTGGEVFLRADFLELYQYARNLGILVSIFSNGTMLTPRVIEVLRELKPRMVEITLYGATQQTYEDVSKVPGSFDKCMEGIDLLLKNEIPLTLKSMVLTKNIHELSVMRDFAKQRGLRYRYDGLLWPRIDGGDKPYQFSLSVEQLIELDNQDPERQAEWQRIYKTYSGKTIRADYVYTCGAGLRSFHIDSKGFISSCTMAREPKFDLRQMDFITAWEKLGQIRELKRELDTVCRTCTIGGLCDQCPGWSQAVHGDNETPVEFVCELAHARVNGLKKSIM